LWLLNGTFDGDYDRKKSVEPLHRLVGKAAEVRWLETGHDLPARPELERMADWLAARLD
jgi:predicted esterase